MLNEETYLPYEAAPRIGRGRALFFAPHPDDEVLGGTAALRQHVRDGDPLKVVIVSDGGFGRGGDQGAYVQQRQRESLKAARILGYEAPEFWGLPDRGLSDHPSLSESVDAALEAYDPDWVYAPSWWEIHPDHRALSAAVTSALRRRATASLVLYEVGVPLHPNRLLDLTPDLDLKRSALSAFESQLAQQAYDRQILGLNAFRAYTLPLGFLAAEAYRVVEPKKLPASLDLPWVLPLCPAGVAPPPQEVAGRL